MKIRYGNIEVNYLISLHGGGMTFGQDFVPVVRRIFRRVERVCEFASGPGFIGFSLLANNLCDTLALVDINPEAVRVCLRTVEDNDLADRVRVYESDGLKNVPVTEKWDLVVGNPPFFKCTRYDYEHRFAQGKLLGFDPDWNIHHQFYTNAGRFLRPGGSILFVESMHGSTPETWRRMIEESGLEYVKCFRYDAPPVCGKPDIDKGPVLRRAKAFLHKYNKDGLRRSFDLGYRESLPLLARIAYDFKILGRDLVDPAWRAVDRNPIYFVWSRLHE